MYSLDTQAGLASAAVVFFGHYGDVTRLAQQRGTCRQALYRQAHAAARALEGTETQQRLALLQQQLDQAHQEIDDLRRRLADAVLCDADCQAEFTATSQALGVSLLCARVLLGVILRRRTPAPATLGRLAQDTEQQIQPILAILDRCSRPRALQVAPDEIFSGRKPVLMTVDQESLCWLGGRLVKQRHGQEWAQEFRQLPALEQITCDRGQGMHKGLALVNGERQQARQSPIDDQSDHFHPLWRARQQVTRLRQQAERALQTAEKKQQAYNKGYWKRRTSQEGHQLRQSWLKAEQAFDRWVAQEKAFAQLRAALRLFTPEGELNTPQMAKAEMAAALAGLDGPGLEKIQRGLGPEALTFLERTEQRLAVLAVAPELVKAAVREQGLQARPEVLQGDEPRARVLRGVLLVARVVLTKAGSAGQQARRLVAGVLRQAHRASSVVEGLNSVLRMHQRRQKRLTQGLLDLKRLYWNMHRFAAGKRKGKNPYQLLGVVLPPGRSWWDLIKMPPEQLKQELSALNPAP